MRAGHVRTTCSTRHSTSPSMTGRAEHGAREAVWPIVDRADQASDYGAVRIAAELGNRPRRQSRRTDRDTGLRVEGSAAAATPRVTLTKSGASSNVARGTGI